MKPSTLDDYKQRMLRVLVYVQDHLDEKLPLSLLARLGCFSPFHFHRIFSGMIGESLKEHVRRLHDACVTVGTKFRPTGDIGLQIIAGGEYAVTTHFGSYNTMGATYEKLFGQWLPRSGRELRSVPCFEIYLNDPESNEPKELLTDIHVPLEPQKTTKLP